MYDQHTFQKRLIKPKHDPTDHPNQPALLEKPSRKRVTASACVACRKRKSKCDSTKPACSACTSVYHTECSYDTDTEPVRKPSSRRPSAKPDVIPSTISGLKNIIETLQSQPDGNIILLNQLKNAQTRLESLALSSSSSDTPLTPVSSIASSVTSSTQDTSGSQLLGVPTHDFEKRNPVSTNVIFDASLPSASWFERPLSQEMVGELFEIYFMYHHAYFPLFSAQHFLGDFHTGRVQFCSSLLIYAILSVACNYWKGKLQSDGNMAQHAEEYGELFANICERKLFNNKDNSLTTVQALAILGLRHGGNGDLNTAYKRHGAAIRMALDMNMHLAESTESDEVDPLELEVQRLTFWGLYNIEMALGLFSGKVPQIHSTSIGIDKPSYSEKRDSFMLQPPQGRRYSDNDMHQEIDQLRYVSHFCELSKLADEVNLSYYAPQTKIGVTDIHYALQRYLSWEHQLPVDYKNTEIGPAKIAYLHMYYKQLIIQLLRPFQAYGTEKLGLPARQMCMERASQIMLLWRHLKSQWLIWEIHMLVLCPLRDAAHIFLLNLHEPSAASYISELIEDIRNLSFLHPMGARIIDSLYSVASQKNINYPKGLFDRHFQDQKGRESISPVNTAAFATRAKIDLDTVPPQTLYQDTSTGQFVPQAQMQVYGQFQDMNVAPHEQTGTYFARPEYQQYLVNQQMSGTHMPIGYQIMQPYQGQVPNMPTQPRP